MSKPGSTSDVASPQFSALLEHLRRHAAEAGVFAECTIDGDCLACKADGSAEDAWYRVRWDGGRVWVSLEMADRWQSESIEAELVHTGDKLDELLEEEMIELGYEGPRPTFEHFRNDDMLFVFRTPLPTAVDTLDDPSTVSNAKIVLLGYEACFRQLGDMDINGDDE